MARISAESARACRLAPGATPARTTGRSGPPGCRLPRPVMTRMSVIPFWTASSTTYWMAGLSTRASISLGWALAAGRNRVPRPAAGMTAFLTDVGHGRLFYHRLGPSRSSSESEYTWHSSGESASCRVRRQEDPGRMPTYEYACKTCGEHLEVVQSFKDDAADRVPGVRGTAAQGVRQHRHRLQGQRVLQDRQPQGVEPARRAPVRAKSGSGGSSSDGQERHSSGGVRRRRRRGRVVGVGVVRVRVGVVGVVGSSGSGSSGPVARPSGAAASVAAHPSGATPVQLAGHGRDRGHRRVRLLPLAGRAPPR